MKQFRNTALALPAAHLSLDSNFCPSFKSHLNSASSGSLLYTLGPCASSLVLLHGNHSWAYSAMGLHFLHILESATSLSGISQSLKHPFSFNRNVLLPSILPWILRTLHLHHHQFQLLRLYYLSVLEKNIFSFFR